MYISINNLKKTAIKLFVETGTDENQAEIISDCLIETEACGVTTHGINMLCPHLKKAENGSYNLSPTFKEDKVSACISKINSENSIGMYSAYFCMKKAIEECKNTGLYIVMARNCNTYGAAFYFAQMASSEGLIGITMSNTPSAMAPVNGKTKLFGTNPFAYAIPAHDEPPIVFDMATSIVAKSKIGAALKAQKEIPEGWALDVNGNPTTDPLEAIKGIILPMAGAKGYGLSLFTDVISGLLSGASYLDSVGRFYDNENGMNVGHTFIALNPELLYGNDFYKAMDGYIKKIRSSEPLPGETVSLPGDRKRSNKESALKNGIFLPDKTVCEINEFARKYGMEELK